VAARPTALGDALQALSAQQAGDALLSHVMAGIAQTTEEPWRAVGAVRSRVRRE
jgi:hypothetical protein